VFLSAVHAARHRLDFCAAVLNNAYLEHGPDLLFCELGHLHPEPMMKLTFRTIIIMAAMTLAGALFIGLGQARAQGADAMKLPRETLAADSEANFSAGSRFLHTGSSQTEMQEATEGLEKLGAAGHITVLDAGTQVRIMGGTKVRIMGGPHAGQVWWLFTDEDVRKPGELPPGAVEER
jgi:hypothetical protein